MTPASTLIGRGAVYRVSGSSMEPTLNAADLLLAEPCDVAALLPGDLVVMQGRRGQGGHTGTAAPAVVHRLVDKLGAEDGFRLRTRGDNRLMDDGIWAEEELVGRVACVWRRSPAGYLSLAVDPRRNRWHAVLARAESRAWAVARDAKRRLLGARSLRAAPRLARVLHGLVWTGHRLLQVTATGVLPDRRGSS